MIRQAFGSGAANLLAGAKSIPKLGNRDFSGIDWNGESGAESISEEILLLRLHQKALF